MPSPETQTHDAPCDATYYRRSSPAPQLRHTPAAFALPFVDCIPSKLPASPAVWGVAVVAGDAATAQTGCYLPWPLA